MASQFPPIIHHITTNSPDGTSSFQPTPLPPPSKAGGPSFNMTYLYSTPPAFTLASNADLTYHLTTLDTVSSGEALPAFPSAGGSIFLMLEIAPNSKEEEVFMHRTNTIEYMFMVDGEVELELDGGETKVLRTGDSLVQRGSWHAWRNLGNEWARMVVVSLGAEGAVETGMEVKELEGKV